MQKIEGGKRLLNPENKIVTNELPLVSIVTVVFNAGKELEKTVQSIVNQQYKNIEYLIIDGNSKDNTLEIIKKYESQIDYWLSEPDKGLYDAMNKAIELATGDYLWFMNAGDLIFSPETLKLIFAEKEFADVYYGETVVINADGSEKGNRRLKSPKSLTWRSFKRGMLVSHQSIIVKRSLTPLFDLTYKYSADFDWVIKILKKASKIKNTNLILTKYLDGGLTKKRLIASLKERFQIMSKNYGWLPTFLRHIGFAIRLSFFYLRNKWF